MAKTARFNGLRRRLRELRAANGANVTITFALATIPLIGFVGAAVDYSHANAVKAAMQMAVDSTALMISKNAATLDSTALQTKANDYFRAMFTRTDASNLAINVTYTLTGGAQVVVNATSDVKTNFMGLMGFASLPVKVTSQVKWGNTKLRVALVLDNTGSMLDFNKIGALKTATNNLLTQLKGAAVTNGDVYVSIIPFVKDVNVGSTNYNQTWVQFDDGTDASWDGINGTCSKSGNSPRSVCLGKGTCSLSSYTSQSTCTTNGTCSLSNYTSQSTCTTNGTCSLSGHNSQSSCTSAGICSNPAETTQTNCTTQKACSNASYTSKSTCQNHGYVWGTGTWTAGIWTTGTWTAGVWTPATWTPNSHNTWNGCVVDRGLSTGPSILNTDTNVMAPTIATPATLYAAEQYSSCPSAAVKALNYDWTAMTNLVNSMTADGNTNQAIGLQLGWMSLVGGGPFPTPPAEDPNYKYTKVIILLTDGLNTQNRWYTTQNSIDTRQQVTCNNVNAAGITLYTVQVNTGGDATSTLLQNCAGSPGKYPDSSKFFLLTSASQMVSTFNQIGTALSNLRIAQ